MLAAADPAQPYGAALPWPSRPEETATSHRPGRKAGAVVVLFAGELALYVERGGKTLLSWTDDPAVLAPCAHALATAVRDGALGRMTVEKADGGAVQDSPLAAALSAAGFRPLPVGCGCAASERAKASTRAGPVGYASDRTGGGETQPRGRIRRDGLSTGAMTTRVSLLGLALA